MIRIPPRQIGVCARSLGRCCGRLIPPASPLRCCYPESPTDAAVRGWASSPMASCRALAGGDERLRAAPCDRRAYANRSCSTAGHARSTRASNASRTVERSVGPHGGIVRPCPRCSRTGHAPTLDATRSVFDLAVDAGWWGCHRWFAVTGTVNRLVAVTHEAAQEIGQTTIGRANFREFG